jgi:hypothetical protein
MLIFYKFDKYYIASTDAKRSAPDPLPKPTAAPGSGQYGYSYMQAAVMARQAAERASSNPRAELQGYLDSPLVAVDDIVAWWGVSILIPSRPIPQR